jgi:hypothetical protein
MNTAHHSSYHTRSKCRWDAWVIIVTALGLYIVLTTSSIAYSDLTWEDALADEEQKFTATFLAAMLATTAIVLFARFVAIFWFAVFARGNRYRTLTWTSEALVPERTAVVVGAIGLVVVILWDAGDSSTVPSSVENFLVPLAISAPLLEAFVTGPHKLAKVLRTPPDGAEAS